MITRFAPSPTGHLHLGHACAAAKVWDAAARAGGDVLLRIEDIDQTRCKPEFEAAILEDLAWLGFRWPEPVRRQSDHFADYQHVLDALRTRGLIYRCFKTRKEVLAEMASTGRSAKDIAAAKGFEAMDTGELDGLLDGLIADNPDEWSRFCGDDEGDAKKMAGFFTGQIMKATRGQADGKVVAQLLNARKG